MNDEPQHIEDNEGLQRAWDYVENTGVSVFLTGKAGTGKTTFLQRLRKASRKALVVVAPTGVAAINAGGSTIHSFFQLPTNPYVPGTRIKEKYTMRQDKIRIIRALDLLVIDEISMVRADLLEAVNETLKRVRRNTRPFGGVQLLMIGDLQQLAPVVTGADEDIMRTYYKSPYFFGCPSLKEVPYVTVTLTKVFRQQDEAFIALLNNVRDSHVTPHDLSLLASRLRPDFVPRQEDGYIRLTTHNSRADSYNTAQLASLKTPAHNFEATLKGTFPDISYPTSQQLCLKEGAQVMFLKNDPMGRFYNGLIGTVKSLDAEHVVVQPVDDGLEAVNVEPMVWENVRYTVNEETSEIVTDVQGTFSQLPLRLAWAITIHKSQGLTFDRVVIDAGSSFSPGQAYVALSRCRSLQGVVLVTPLSQGILDPDATVASYLGTMAQAEKDSIERLPAIKADYVRDLMIELFNFDEMGRTFDNMARHFSQVFAKMYPSHNRLMADNTVRWRASVIETAHKWTARLRLMATADLTSPAVLARTRKGAAYFAQQLRDIAVPAMLSILDVRSNNKKAMQRLKDLYLDLNSNLWLRYRLLNYMADHDFDTQQYLDRKKRYILPSDSPEWPSNLRPQLPIPGRPARTATKSAKNPAPKPDNATT